jgi:MFS family permease
VRWALMGCILLALLTALFQWFMIEPPVDAPVADKPAPVAALEGKPASAPGRSPPGNSTGRPGLSDGIPLGFRAVVNSFSPTLRELLVSDILIRFCERIPYAFVILWAMNSGGMDAQRFGYLVVVEMTTAMLCYIPVARLADKHGRRPFVLATFLFFTLFPLTLFWAKSFLWLAAAFAVRGLKEFGEPARKALIIGEAAPALRSRTYGAYYLIRDCVVTTGSFLGAWLWSVSPQANFVGASVFGALGTLWFWWFVYRRTVDGAD